jgi:poly(hydroxyalkanoate) depolymerase family esterase
MKTNTKMTELMRDVPGLALTFGTTGALRNMQRAMHRTISTGTELMLNNSSIAIRQPMMDAAANQPFLHVSQASRRISASWPYVDVEAAAAMPQEETVGTDDQPSVGQFVEGSVTNQAGTRNYKLYIPSGYDGQPLPLVVMLHGCKQDPDDFAAGTRMNAMAEEKQCFVLYPAQSRRANDPKCWSWFSAADQVRERGEPSLIADMTRNIMRDYHVDESMIYVAGLSAGGAMAVIMATEYPEIFAAAAVHSGMPYSAAKSLFSALSAMKNGPRRRWYDITSKSEGTAPAVPMIVFHGDADRVVHPINGDHVIRQAVEATSGPECDPVTMTTTVERNAPERRSYTRTIYHDERGRDISEQWVIHGSGHAWSGGCSDGSYTDPNGPDATNEMMRFFYDRKLMPAQRG